MRGRKREVSLPPLPSAGKKNRGLGKVVLAYRPWPVRKRISTPHGPVFGVRVLGSKKHIETCAMSQKHLIKKEEEDLSFFLSPSFPGSESSHCCALSLSV